MIIIVSIMIVITVFCPYMYLESYDHNLNPILCSEFLMLQYLHILKAV